MTQYNIEELKNSSIAYMKTQNAPVTYETVGRRLNIQRKVMRYVFKLYSGEFKVCKRHICLKRHVYTL